MSWIEELIATYDANADIAGKSGISGMKQPLLPIGHMFQNAQIEVTLDGKGNLLHAEVISKENQPTIIPCTPDSSSRTSSPSPHPLHDNLSYVARDYEKYAKKPSKEISPYEMYCCQLGKWAASANAPNKVKAVYNYVANHDLITDLCNLPTPIFYRDENGSILEKWTDTDRDKPPIFNIVTGDMLKQFVRFRVDDDDGIPDLWKDRELQKAYIEYAKSLHEDEENICYATGTVGLTTNKHSKAIRFAGDGAKLISSNDSSGYTFRGRFAEADEAVTVGYEASQKAMNALKWLISNQGYIESNDRVFLAWNSRKIMLPPIIKNANSHNFVQRRRNRENKIPNTLKGWADELSKAIAGYKHDLTKANNIKVNVMVLDAATPGRLSICYYDELSGAQFIKNIERWHTLGAWQQHIWLKEDNSENEKNIRYYGVPSPDTIITACYGKNINEKRKKLEIEKIFYCITQGKNLPLSFERAAYNHSIKKAGNMNYYKWRQDILEPACTLFAKHFNIKKEEYKVSLDENNNNRSYLYGRMMAVADQLEKATYNDEERGKRETNAMKYMEIMAMKPAATWANVQKRLLPYQQKQERYGGLERKLLNKIGSMFSEEDFLSNKPLDGRFLLGFYCQAYTLEQEIAKRVAAKKAKEEKTFTNENGEE